MGLTDKLLSSVLMGFLILIPIKNINEKEFIKKIQPKNSFAENNKNYNSNIYKNTNNYFLSMNHHMHSSLLIESALNSREKSKKVYKIKKKPEDYLISRIYLNSIMGISYILEFIKRTKLTCNIGKKSKLRYKDKAVQWTYNYKAITMGFSAGFNDPFFTSGSSAQLEKILKFSLETSYFKTRVYAEVEKGEFENKLNFKFGKSLDFRMFD